MRLETLLRVCAGSGVSAVVCLKLLGWNWSLFTVDNIVVFLSSLKNKAITNAKTEEEVIASGTRKGLKNQLAKVSARLGYEIEVVQVPVREGEIDVHIHKPAGERHGLPMIVWFHGGGMCVGSAFDSPALHWPGFGILEHFQGKAVVASVDYRMAPKFIFPTGAEDAISATRWLQARAEQFGCDPGSLSVAGVSAGGYLAAVVHQAARDRDFPLRCAVIIEPMCRYGCTTRSYIENGRGLGLTTELMTWFWLNYCPDPASAADPRCEPIRGVGAGGLAPCLITTSEYDVLRDEGFEYFEALQRAGVQAHHIRFQTSHVCPPADRPRLRDLLSWWASALGTPEQSRL